MQHGETAKSLATVYYEECVERVGRERGERERETERGLLGRFLNDRS
jgi:hypothetical protein